MRICWVLGQEIQDEELDAAIISEVAPSWGSWSTWKKFKTDNCICTDTGEAQELIKRAFHAVCNLYIMQDSYIQVGSPQGVKLFNGKFQGEQVDNKDDIVALNLAAPNHDIVLMSGFNFSPIKTKNKIAAFSREEYYFNIIELIKANSTVQFVLVDYTHELASWLEDLENLSFDTISSVESLLV